VAHSLSAKKRIRQNVKTRARNRARKDMIKTEMKAFQSAVTSGDLGKARTQLSVVASRLDKVASKGSLHKKTAARKRSRLALRLNALAKSGAAAVKA